jgi:transcriptional regulator with PAS, ATPase and Fis domain
VWESIFTHNLRRYQRSLYRRLGDVTTLITGPSGTGKELVARAIGLSRYVPFDGDRGRFVENFFDGFHAVNLSALSPTLIESELFGHRRGAFTGAVADRVGWLESCPTHGAVFLDEIGEVDPAIQVKLLRVLQSRNFQRLGDTANLSFCGKIIAATNRDLKQEIDAGRFREDFYYRLCADRIATPTLRQQLDECPEDLEHLLLMNARRTAPEEAESLADEVAHWIRKKPGPRLSLARQRA